jgi:phage tail sheath gpL-like
MLTNISDRKTPSTPSELTFDAETGLPSDLQELLIFGHAASTTAASAIHTVRKVNNVADPDLAEDELGPIYGADSELVKMVKAAITAASDVGTFPNIRVIALEHDDTDFGPSDEALDAAKNVKAEFIVTPYDLQNDSANRTKLRNHIILVSGTERPDNGQFGSIGVGANFDEEDPSQLEAFDTQFLCGIWLRDTGSNPYSLGEVAAAAAARMAANEAPFNPLDSVRILGITAPADQADWISVGAGLESESCLGQGWTPLRVKPNGDVAFVRTVTGRLTNGVSPAEVTAYYDVQDFQVLYFWRKTIWTRENQPDFKNVKASQEKAKALRGELVRLMQLFQDQGMFQAVSQLAKELKVERSTSDRHRFDVLTPVNVIPGLHVIANRISATTRFDAFSI